MGLVTEKPEDLKSSNDLDDIPDEPVDVPAAYLRFGTTSSALEEPPALGEVRTYIVRARCIAEHGPIERKDGETRYLRALMIQAAWESGKKPPAADDEQPGLFDDTGDDQEGQGDSDDTDGDE